VADYATLEGGCVAEESGGGLASCASSLSLPLVQCLVIDDNGRRRGSSNGRTGRMKKGEGKTYLCLFPASKSPSTVELKLPSAPSTTVSQLLCISSHAALLLPCFSFSPLTASGPFTGPLERVAWRPVPVPRGAAVGRSSSERSSTYSPSESAMVLWRGWGHVLVGGRPVAR
jgi:hypothetical protein